MLRVFVALCQFRLQPSSRMAYTRLRSFTIKAPQRKLQFREHILFL